ncbi:MAG: YncE family protein [Gammaproteobacteria bacterium]
MNESILNHLDGKTMLSHGKHFVWICVIHFMFSMNAIADRDYTLFEVDPVRPVATLERSGHVAVLNIPDDYLELFKPVVNGLRHCASIKVGMRPVAIGVISESENTARVWVVNHLSDSISVLKLNLRQCSGRLVDTIAVGDEPRDIVVANTPAGKRVFVTMAHRGQNHPDDETRSWQDLIRTGPENEATDRPAGLADVAVINPENTRDIKIINLLTDTPRALALGAPDSAGYHTLLYAAGFHTGNKTTVIAAETARGVAVEHLNHLLETGDVAASANGDLILARAGVKMRGGSPAVRGKGRCFPDPREERKRRHELQICAQTDDDHRILAFKHQQAGVADQDCSCSNAYGEIQPVVSMIVKFYDTPDQCGEAFDDRIGGCWLDRDPELKGVGSPAMDWNDSVKFTLPDNDVFELNIGADGSTTLAKSYSGVGTLLFGMVSHPGTGKVYVANQDANNLTRFEGLGHFAGTSVRGTMSESRISVIDNGLVAVKPLNDHLGLTPDVSTRETALAFPVALAMTAHKVDSGAFARDQQLFFAALGSDKLAYVSTSALDAADVGDVNQRIKYIALGKTDSEGKITPSGPVGMSLDQTRQRLYLLARFTNELIEVNTATTNPALVSRYAMNNPEPRSITDGRSIFYSATEMSANGDQACASCHAYANNDSLAWDLGNPDNPSVNNPGPFVSPPAVGFVGDLAIDPSGLDPFLAEVNPDFRSNKGPMLTQPLRGLANHGAMHWRGDRVRNVQFTMGENPDVGTLDEENSIREFDEAVRDLEGGDEVLDAKKMDALADFLMQISYPPNPLRHLDNSLTDDEQAGRSAFFGCQSMTDEQFVRRECTGFNGQLVQIDEATRDCECFGNPVRFVMERLTHVQAFASAFEALQLTVSAAGPGDQQLVGDLQGRLEDLKVLARQVAALQRQSLSSFALPGNQAGFNHQAKVFNDGQLHTIQLFVAGAEYPDRSDGFVGFIAQAKELEKQLDLDILEDLLAQLQLPSLPPETSARLTDPEQISSVLTEWFGDANVSRKPLLDAQLSPGEEQDPLQGCSLDVSAQSCPLRIADSLTTCQGCHVLDPEANRRDGFDFPGFFGTGGEYAFSNIPQVFKVPHLRNLYSRVGKFGQAHEPEMFVGQSVFGIREGGFFDRDTPVIGPSVRGYGFSHDGSADTVHRFAGLLDFLRRPAGFLGANDVRGNPDAFDAFVPSDPQACIATVIQGRDEFFNLLQADRTQMIQAATAALAGDKAAAGQIVQTVLASSAVQTDSRWQTIASSALDAFLSQKPITDGQAAPIVEAVASSLFCPDVPSPELLPLCFQLGSALESGDKNGVCYPAGLKERSAVEAFALVFDTNLKPMVGQQVTIKKASKLPALFTDMLKAASAGYCDLGGWDGGGNGYLFSHVNPDNPMSSRLLSDKLKQLSLARLLRKAKSPVTFTCYPPQRDQAEAKRSVWDRNADGVPNGVSRRKIKKGV